MVTGGSDEIVSFLGPWSSPLCKKTQKDIWLTSTTRTTTTAQKNAKKIKSIHQPPPKKRQNPNKIMAEGGSGKKVSFWGPLSSSLCKKKSHKSNINIYNKDNNNRTKKTKKSPKIQHILNDHHQKPGKIPFRSEAKVDLAKEFHSWDSYSHSYAKKIKKIYN